MTCGQCGADLLGSGKFCASCGAPVHAPSGALPAAAPSSSGAVSSTTRRGLSDAVPPAHASPAPADTNMLFIPPSSEPPAGDVNPFAATAPPGSALPQASPSQNALKAVSGALSSSPVAIESKKLDSTPPSPRAVSPLAVSNGVSGRTPFQEAVEKARQSVAPAALAAAAAKKQQKPRTQLMADAPKRPATPDAAPTTEEPKKRAVPKTVAMTPPAPSPRSNAGAPSVAHPNSAAQAAPHSVLAPSGHGGVGQAAPNSYIAAPSSVAPGAMGQQFQTPQQPPYVPQPLAPYQQPPAPAYPPPQWGAPPPSYGFQYAPGSRVQVTWSNGQRYPATVSQINGPQCLVVFPDGQQHWVQMQYLTPG